MFVSPYKISVLALSVSASLISHAFAQTPATFFDPSQYKVTCENHHQNRWDQIILVPKSSSSTKKYFKDLYRVTLKQNNWILESIHVNEQGRFTASDDQPLATQPQTITETTRIIKWAKHQITLNKTGSEEPTIDFDLGFVVDQDHMPFAALECSKDDTSNLRYTAEIEEYSKGYMHHTWRGSDAHHSLNSLPSSLRNLIPCPSDSRKDFLRPDPFSLGRRVKDAFSEHYAKVNMPHTETSIYALNACHGSQYPIQVWIEQTATHDHQTSWKSYHIEKIKDPFTIRENNQRKGYDAFKLSGTSLDGQSVAISVLNHNEKGDYSSMIFDVTVIKQGKTYQLPRQKVVNSYGRTPDALLSDSGHRLVINTGISVKLFEYNSTQDQFLLIGKQSLKSLHPWSYSEGSLRISPKGEQVTFDMRSPHKVGESDTEKSYLVHFTPDTNS